MRSTLFFSFVLVVILQTPSQGLLPEISKEQLLVAVQSADQLLQNYQATYTIDETFMPNFNRKYSMPRQRQLDMSFTRENEKYFYDIRVTAPEDQFNEFPQWSYQDAFNGRIRTQFNPGSQYGDVFANPFKHAFPIPQDFGLSLGSREKTLGQDLSESEILSIESVTHNGAECYYVQATKSSGHPVEVWIDPAIGFRARSMRLFNIKDRPSYEFDAEFSQNEEGLWFPSSATARLYGNTIDGQRDVSTLRQLTVHQVQLNRELTTEDLTIDFPPGAKVYDHIVGIGYEVGVTSIEGVLDEQLDQIAFAARNNHFTQAPQTISQPQVQAIPVRPPENTLTEKTDSTEPNAPVIISVDSPKIVALPKKQKNPIIILVTFATIVAAIALLLVIKRRT